MLDVGCGPGMAARALLRERPGQFQITALGRSPAMAELFRAGTHGQAAVTVGRAESLPFANARFDVVMALGVLEYVDIPHAVAELARVTRPGGLLIVSMLNPLSPYRLFEWGIYRPAVRLAGRLETMAGVPARRRHAADRTGVGAIPARLLVGLIRAAGLEVDDVTYYDVTYLLPPLDRAVHRRATDSAAPAGLAAPTKSARHWFGTGYLIAATRPGPGGRG